MPYNPAKLPFTKSYFSKIFLKSIIPEGWGFFTKNPREPYLTVYNSHLEKISQVNSSISNVFGIKKTTRAQNIELGFLLQKVKENDWIECKTQLSDCYSQNMKCVGIRNLNKSPLLCGKIILEKKAPVPWAWSNYAKNIDMPSKIVVLCIDCN